MRPSRRTFIVRNLLAGCLAVLSPLSGRSARAVALTGNEGARSQHIDSDTLAAHLDTLIPADNSPAAVELGVMDKLLARAARDAAYRRLLVRGCQWLDARSRSMFGAGFSTLDLAKRERIVAAAADSPPRSVPRVFFRVTWDDAVFHYYADPRSWPTLGYAGPPQPRGFPDHARAPGR